MYNCINCIYVQLSNIKLRYIFLNNCGDVPPNRVTIEILIFASAQHTSILIQDRREPRVRFEINIIAARCVSFAIYIIHIIDGD